MKTAILSYLLLLQAATPPRTPTLFRQYQEGEPVAYQMHGLNQGHQRTIRYDVRADGVVKKDGKGTFLEEFAWSNLLVNGEPFTLPPQSQQFRESLSLDPGYTLSIPDLSKVQPILIGPITDLLSFYADVQLSMRQNLIRSGDHVLVKHGKPNSWADGTYTLFGQDAVDFDITLGAVDQQAHVAKLVVRHIPPGKPEINFPAQWMLAPVATGSANNWVEVDKTSAAKFMAQVGMETFQADIKISLPSGRILSAIMDNPVEVLERDCDDEALTVCGEPFRFTIKREINIGSIEPSSH